LVHYLPSELTTLRARFITITMPRTPTATWRPRDSSWASYFEFAYDAAFGSEGGVSKTLSSQGRSDGGDLWSDRGEDFEAQRIEPDFIQDSELKEFLAIASKLGTHTDCWFDLVPGEASARGIYRRGQRKFTSTGMNEPREYGIHRQAFELEEP
jgi:hypothetical protein